MAFLSYSGSLKVPILSVLLLLANTGCAHTLQSSSKENVQNGSKDSMESLIAEAAYNPTAPLESLGPAYTSQTKGNIYEIRYCPDNTCEILQSSNKNKQSLNDFAFIYFSRVSTYSSLQSFQKSVPDEAVRQVQSKYSSTCTKADGSGIKCQLKEMSQRFKIKSEFSRFDEGVESFTPILINN